MEVVKLFIKRRLRDYQNNVKESSLIACTFKDVCRFVLGEKIVFVNSFNDIKPHLQPVFKYIMTLCPQFFYSTDVNIFIRDVQGGVRDAAFNYTKVGKVGCVLFKRSPAPNNSTR